MCLYLSEGFFVSINILMNSVDLYIWHGACENLWEVLRINNLSDLNGVNRCDRTSV